MATTQENTLLPVHNATESYWHSQRDGFHDHRTTAELPAQTDVLIIGAGYAGTATAWHLVKGRSSAQPKNSVTVLEARGACSGATGRNGGHMRPDLWGHIPKYITREGMDDAVDLALFEISHVQALKSFIEEQDIDCDFVLSRSVDTWANQEAADTAKQVYERMVSHGIDYMKDVWFTHGPKAESISGVKGAKACASYTAGMMWPYKFITHLLKSLVATGDINLQTNTPVTSITPLTEGGFTVETPRGSINATKIIHAQNAYVAGVLPEYSASIIPCKGICCHIDTPANKEPPLLATSYIERNADKNLSYLIPRPDGSIVVGGASGCFRPFLDQWYNNTDDSILIDSAKDYYNGYMQRTFRGWEDSDAEVKEIWTGVMGYSYDSHAHIGSVPGKDGQFVIAGFNGHGMPVIWLGAQGLAKMVRDGVEYEKIGIPNVFKTTQERIDRARNGKEDWGDILGDGRLQLPN